MAYRSLVMRQTTRVIGIVFTNLLLLASLVSMMAADGCTISDDGSGTPTPQATGFSVETQDADKVGLITHYNPHNAVVSGTDEAGQGTGSGTAVFGPVATGFTGVYNVAGGLTPATWDSLVQWGYCPDIPNNEQAQAFSVTAQSGINWTCDVSNNIIPTVVGLYGSTPSTVTVSSFAGNPASASYGQPQLLVYNQANGYQSSIAASSVNSGGTSSTFPFPKTAAGQALAPGFYALVVKGQNSSGLTENGVGGLTIASPTTVSGGPFGVAAGSSSVLTVESVNNRKTSETRYSNSFPVISLFNNGQLTTQGHTIQVGTRPTAVVAYGSYTSTSTNTYGSTLITTTTTQTANALVVNSGSNSVTIADLVQGASVATIAVGTNPVAAAVQNTTGYVVNHGSNTVSVINLTTHALTNTISVGSAPTSITLDGSGFAWIGGNGYAQKLNLSTLTIAATETVSGTITALAYSAGESQLVTNVAPASSSLQGGAVTYQPSPFASANTVAGASHAYSDFSGSSLASQLSWPAQMANGAIVSPNLNNDLAVISSGTSFSVIEIQTGQVILQGVLPGVIRGFAVDSSATTAYVTLPDNNMLVSIPLPTAN
jgi:YVTN family beta-propeller protein